ncbi:MAG: ATP-binding protein [Candidatus Krumholzibacteriia bacterium]
MSTDPCKNNTEPPRGLWTDGYPQAAGGDVPITDILPAHLLLVVVMVVIFTAEVLVMSLLHEHPPPVGQFTTWLLDSALLIVLVFPALYFFLHRPMSHRFARIQQGKRQVDEAFSLLCGTLEAATDGILVLDNDGKAVTFSRRCKEMWRVPDDIVVNWDNDRLLEFTLDQLKDPEGYLAGMRELRGQPYRESQDVLEFKDGRAFERSSRPQWQNGEVVGRVWTFHDVTGREQGMRNMRKAKELAESASRSKSAFLANISHELRTPLNAIIGFSDVLKDGHYGALEPKQMEYLEHIREGGAHLASLINDVIAVSQVESRIATPTLSRVDVPGLLRDSVGAKSERAAAKNLSLEVDIAPEVEGLEISADEEGLSKVVGGFLSNAITFTPEGGVITTSASQIGEELIVSVTDAGVGISPADQARIFEPLFQVRGGLADKTPGLGLGLSICRGIVEMHGGRIWVESDGEGKGSRFSFALPLNQRVGVTG